MKLLTAIIIAFSPFAHAKPMVVGPYMDRAQLPESICMVTVEQKTVISFSLALPHSSHPLKF